MSSQEKSLTPASPSPATRPRRSLRFWTPWLRRRRERREARRQAELTAALETVLRPLLAPLWEQVAEVQRQLLPMHEAQQTLLREARLPNPQEMELLLEVLDSLQPPPQLEIAQRLGLAPPQS